MFLKAFAWCSIACLFVSMSFDADAFEGAEHESLGNLALPIAMKYACKKNDGLNGDALNNLKKKCRDIHETVNELLKVSYTYKTLENAKELQYISYGEIIELVDFMHYPEQIFESFNAGVDYSTMNVPFKASDLNWHVIHLMKKHGVELLDYLSASSHNERHFQDSLMVSMNSLHMSAISDAKNKNLYSALVRNALSDHYLHDFFAPGHITTLRENSHDAVALAMHDWSNKSGTCFKLNDKVWPDLLDILSFIKDNELQFVMRSGAAVSSYLYQIKKNFNECGAVDNFESDSWDDIDDFNTYQSIVIDALLRHPREIFVQGDSFLKYNPLQQLLILLVQISSINEVLKAYIESDNNSNDLYENSERCKYNTGEFSTLEFTTNYCWQGIFISERVMVELIAKDIEYSEIVAPHAEIKFGMYDFSYDEIPLEDNSDQIEYVGFIFPRPKYAFPSVADNAFMLSFGGQIAIDKDTSRFVTQFELLPLAIGTSNAFKWLRDATVQRPSTVCGVFSLCNLGVAYGVSYVDGHDLNAIGGQVRFIKVLPKISGQISVNIRRNKYLWAGEHVWKNSIGLRYDHGFSLHTFYIGFQYGHEVDDRDSLNREGIITFGWSLSFPTSRLSNYFN